MFITRKTTTLILAFSLIFANFLFPNSLSIAENGDGTWNVNYSSDSDIGGFQFNTEGATIVSASGGDAAANGFMVSTSATTALGFSLSGGTIPAGDGTLLVLSVDGNLSGLSSIVVSDPSGSNLDFTFDSGEDVVEPDHVVEVGRGATQFSPQDISIEVGETVQWVNLSGFHNVNGSTDTFPNNPASFSSGASSSDAWTYSFTFDIEGVYDYQCDPHAGMGMAGTVTVGNGGGDYGGEGVIGDEPNSLWLIENGDGSWSIGFNSSDDIGGFQLNIDGASINGASGGAATDAGFMLSTSATTVL